MLEAAAALEGELKDARVEAQLWKSTSEANKIKLKSVKAEAARHMDNFRGAHVVAKCLEKEKFALMKENDELACLREDLEGKL